MADAFALGLASAALVARVQDLTSRALRPWSERWQLEATADAAEADPASAIGDAAGELLFESPAGGAAATLWWPASLESALGRLLFGAPATARTPGDSLAARSVHHVSTELRRLLSQAWGVQGWQAVAPADAPAPTRWHALVDVRVTVAGATFVARVPSMRLRQPATPLPGAGLSRTQTLAAFAPLKARATAVVGQAEISVAELANVQCGDVLLIDSSLSEPLRIEIDGAPGALRAGLGLVGRHRAVQLISPSAT